MILYGRGAIRFLGSALARLLAANDDFFPDLGNLFLDDMGDNVNADGAAPAATYVILSFLFKIVAEFMFLVCALDVICSSTMLARMISLISAIAAMIYRSFGLNLVVIFSYFQHRGR